MSDLFTPISRTDRQKECESKWIKAGGHNTLVCATGFGKTRIGTDLIGRFLIKRPDFKIIVVVPTTTLKEQWEGLLDSLGYGLNCEVYVINTIALKQNIKYSCDFLILDEAHRFVSDVFAKIFDLVSYKYILGLTATIERLDGKEKVIKEYCPVCDEVPLSECLANGWISPYKEYQVLIDVDDIEEYKELNKRFNEHFG